VNKQNFVAFIRKPEILTTKNLEEIEGVIITYPYFQNARIILAKGSKIKNLAESKERIASAAIYASNRTLLKKYINDELIFLRPLEVHESIQTDLKPGPKASKQSSPTDNIVTESTVEAESITAETDNIPQEIIEPEKATSDSLDDKIEKEAVKKIESIKEEITDPHPIAPNTAPSDLDDLISELWKDVEELRKSKARFQEIEKRIEEEDAVEKAVKKATESTSTKKPTEKPTNKVNTNKAVPKPVPKKSTVKATPTSTSRAKKSDKKSSEDTDKKDQNSSESDKESHPKADLEPNKDEQSEIIDSFIKTNPSMPKPVKSEAVKMEDLSQESIEMNAEIASEYLAEIYLEQGRKDRSIQIYEKLIVKFPEKSVYFADIIKKLNKGS
jgi:tetratricopeptide (TPR) repeat protein